MYVVSKGSPYAFVKYIVVNSNQCEMGITHSFQLMPSDWKVFEEWENDERQFFFFFNLLKLQIK